MKQLFGITGFLYSKINIYIYSSDFSTNIEIASNITRPNTLLQWWVILNVDMSYFLAQSLLFI